MGGLGIVDMLDTKSPLSFMGVIPAAIHNAGPLGMAGVIPAAASMMDRKKKQANAAPAAASPGLAMAAQQIQSASRAPDTELAHVTPDEAQFIDMLQGGRRTNPITGLPEYGQFGDILKAVARAAGAIGGFMVAGPVGAAAGAGAATKLTGGSWKEAATAAALAGVGGEAGQGLTGGGWSPIGTNNVAAGFSPTLTNAAPNSIPLSQIGSTPVSSPTFLQTAKSWPGLAAAAGANIGAAPQAQNAPPLQQPQGNKINLNVVPQPRTYQPYPGDPLHFAEPGQGGQGYEFYNPLNPQPIYQSAGGPVNAQPMNTDFRFRHGGAVRAGLAMADGGDVPDAPMDYGAIIRDPERLQQNLGVVMGMGPGVIGSGPFKGMTMAEKMDIQGGSLSSKPGVRRIMQALESHGIEYDLTNDGVQAYMPFTDKFGRLGKEVKTFKENTSLKTLRDWLGYADGGPVHMADGGNPAVMAGPSLGMRGGRGAMAPALPTAVTQVPAGGIGGIGHNEDTIRRAALLGYSAAGGMTPGMGGMGMARGGTIKGPGDGKSDSIPAMLSSGEHVIDAASVSALGDGDNDAGQKRLEMFKQMIRSKAGQKNPHKPTPSVGDPRAMMRRAIGK